jgi:cellulose synthase/poly-beta-1,6-N-acetylglucosamine synthase-like glycosyltransferase
MVNKTASVARALAQRHPDTVRVVVDTNWPKNKPKALNTALPFCQGEVVGVFDAEDEVDRRLLGAVDRAFGATGADVVQGGVQLINFRSSWFSLRNCLEYFFWFRSRLHLHEQHRFIPLGGNTVFVRTDLLRLVGGWDAECLAEDCELGVRLSALGASISVCYDPHLVTREVERLSRSRGALLRDLERLQHVLSQATSVEFPALPPGEAPEEALEAATEEERPEVLVEVAGG